MHFPHTAQRSTDSERVSTSLHGPPKMSPLYILKLGPPPQINKHAPATMGPARLRVATGSSCTFDRPVRCAALCDTPPRHTSAVPSEARVVARSGRQHQHRVGQSGRVSARGLRFAQRRRGCRRRSPSSCRSKSDCMRAAEPSADATSKTSRREQRRAGSSTAMVLRVVNAAARRCSASRNVQRNRPGPPRGAKTRFRCLKRPCWPMTGITKNSLLHSLAM